MPIPESVKVTFKGSMKNYMDFRDVVHATQAQMLDQFDENVFHGKHFHQIDLAFEPE